MLYYMLENRYIHTQILWQLYGLKLKKVKRRFFEVGKVRLLFPLLLLVCIEGQAQVASFPYSESFETDFGDWVNVAVDDFDWTRDCCGTPSDNTGPSSANDGSFYLYTEASAGNNPAQEAYVQATFDFSNISAPEFSFFYHMFGAAMGSLHMDVNDGNWNLDVWSISGQQHTSGTAEWSKVIVDLSAFGNQNNIIVRLRGITGTTWQSDMAIDNISCIDNCNVNPGNATISLTVICNAGGGTVDLSLSGHDGGTTLQWQQSSDGISFTDILGDTLANYTTATLTPTQAYYFRCAVTNGCVSFSDTVSVIVSASNGTVNTYPYVENFNASLGLWNNVGGDNFDWTRDCCGTPSVETGPTDDNTPGSFYVFTEASGANYPGQSAFLELTFDFTGITNPELSFYYHMFGIAMGTLNVDVNTDNSVWSISGQQQAAQVDPFTYAALDLSKYAGLCNVTIRFRGVTGASWQSDMAIDDVSLYDCSVVAGTATISTGAICTPGGGAVDLTVSGYTGGSSIQWQQSTGGIPYADIIGATTATYTTATLAPTNIYYFRAAITSGCTRYSDTVNVNVEVGGGTIVPPHSESFETGFGDWVNLGNDNFDWARISGGTPSDDTGPLVAHEGSFYAYTEASDPNYPSQTAFLQASFDFTGITNPALSFFYHMFGGNMGTLSVLVNGATVWSKTGAEQTAQADPWVETTIDLSAYANQCNVAVEFRGVTGNGWQSDMAVDKISCNYICTLTPGTAAITPEAICASVGGTVDLSLTGQDGGTTLQWQQSIDNFSYTDIPGATSANYTTTTLTPTQIYYFRCAVTSGCTSYSDTVFVNVGGGGGTINIFPYSENFDASLGVWGNVIGDDFDWTRNSAGTPSTGTGPTDDNGGGGFYLFTEASDPNNPSMVTFLDATADFTALTVPQFSFYYHMFGAEMGSLFLEVNGTIEWSISGQQQVAQGDAYVQVKVDLSAYAGECLVNLRFKGITGTTFLSDMAIDEILICDAPITSAITGPDSVCINDQDTYFVTNNIPNTYTWVVDGGAIISGQGLSSIDVDWGATGTEGSVKVLEANGCTSADTVTLLVNSNPIAPTAIAGDVNVPEFSQDKTYKVTGRPGYTYTWTIVGGTVDFGQGTDSITVDWNGPGPITGDVSVIASAGGCGSVAAINLAVSVGGYILSTQDGSWDAGTTWAGGIAPTATDNARIASGHLVTLTAAETIIDIEIDAGSTLDNDNFILTVEGDYMLNGRHTGNNTANARVHLQGTGTDISGTGTLDSLGQIRILTDRNFSSSTNLTLTETKINLYTGVTITNNGTLRIDGGIYRVTGTPTWINAMNSVLRVTESLLLSNAIFNASAAGNIVEYNGGNQTVTMPSGNYYHLILSNAGTKTLQGNVDINGNLNVTGVTLDASASNFNINLAGNGTITGSFTERNGTFTFDGSSAQTLTCSATETFHNLIFEAGSNVQTAATNDSLGVSGNWVNNGTFNAQAGFVNFNGGAAQTISGSSTTSFHNMILSNTSGGVSLSSAQNLTGTLTLTLGTFNTNGQNFTLVSTATGTANIAEITGGDITGNIIMQRFIAAGNTGYHFLSTPVSGITLNDWDQEMVLSIPDGNNGCSGSCWLSVKFYNEPTAGLSSLGYDSLSSVTDAIIEGQGYWVYTGTGPLTSTAYTLDSRGPANKNYAPITVNHTVSAGDTEDGWNLIGNPYPSDISWDLVALSGTITPFGYIWDPNASPPAYISFDQSSGQTISSHQALWVKVAEGGMGTHSETVTIDESDKAADGNNFLKTGGNPNPHLHINLSGVGCDMSTEVRFNPDATDAYDWQFDAFHLRSLTNYTPNLSTKTTSGPTEELSINSVPDLSQNISIPVRITWPSDLDINGNPGGSQTYTISVDLEDMPANSCVLLEDLWPPYNITDLRQDTFVTFTMTQAQNLPPHFMLHIGAQSVLNINSISCFGAADGIAISSGQGTGPWVYTWLNQQGDTVSGPNTINGSDSLIGLTAGTYTVYTSSSILSCATSFKEFSIEEPEVISAQGILEDVSCFGKSDGNINLAIDGGTPPYSAEWTNGNNTHDNFSILAGPHMVTITDANNCSYTNSYTLIEPPEIVTIIALSDISCFGADDGAIEIATTGGNAPYDFLWNNGEMEEDLFGLQAGIYIIQVTDYSNCTITAGGLNIAEGIQVIAGFSTSMTAAPAEVQFTNLSVAAVSYLWAFGDGDTSTDHNPVHTYPAKGTYSVVLTAINGVCTDNIYGNVLITTDPLAIYELDSEDEVRVYLSDWQVILEFNYTRNTEISIQVYNSLGQRIAELGPFSTTKSVESIDLANRAEGAYLIKVVEDSGNQATFKLVR